MVRPQTTARGVGILFGLLNRTPFDRAPAWRELRALPPAEQLAALRDPAAAGRLIADGARRRASMLGPDMLFVLPPGPARYDCRPEDSLAAHAARRGVSPVEAFIDLALETRRRGHLQLPVPQPAASTRSRRCSTTRWSRSGLADAGAHVGQIMDASQPTFFLTYWVRERQRWTLEEAVRRLTSDTADLFGITDRGVLRPGAFADVNVIDLDEPHAAAARVRPRLPQRRRPLRPGRQRLRLHDRERRGLHGPRRAHRRAGRTGGPLSPLKKSGSA